MLLKTEPLNKHQHPFIQTPAVCLCFQIGAQRQAPDAGIVDDIPHLKQLLLEYMCNMTIVHMHCDCLCTTTACALGPSVLCTDVTALRQFFLIVLLLQFNC